MSHVQRKPQSRFFDDIVVLILDAHDNWWPRDLCRLARVSQAWLPPTRKRLYSRPSPTSFASCRQLSQTLRANPYLTSLLWGIELKPLSLDGGTQATPLDLSALRFLLSLEGLQYLHLGGELAFEAERFIGCLSCSQSITTLSIDGAMLADKLGSPASLEWDDFVAFRFPNLRVLRLSYLELDISYPTSPPPFSLQELSLNNVAIVGGSITQLLRPTQLPHFTVTMSDGWDCDPAQIQSVLTHCSVESFRLEARGMTSQWQGFFETAWPPFPSLQDLILDEVFLDYDNLVSISEHCPCLRRLRVVGRAGRVAPPQWTDFIISGALPQLNFLALPRFIYEGPSVASWSDIDASTLRDACASRNIVATSCI